MTPNVGGGEDENLAQRTKEKHLKKAGENQEKAKKPGFQEREGEVVKPN